ncbi:MAG: AAA family ATPase [Calditrichaeota bacterium]|nr:AAA family ATPase [Calditrichota bacterium]
MEYYELLGLNEEPFTSSPNPRFLFKAKEHRECLNRLEIAVRLRRGLSIVLGRIGTGKTTLSRTLLQMFQQEQEDYAFGLILDPIFPSEYVFLRNLMDHFDIKTRARSVLECKNAIESFLFQKGVEEGKRIVLIIDEGQNLTPTYLETLRNLLNYETNEYKLLQLVIFAQLDFLPRLSRNPNFEDRVTTSYMLNPLNEQDTKAMIEYRLQQAGWDGQRQFFTDQAFQEIYIVTRGYPRRVTNLCHNCLIEILRRDSMQVDLDVVQYVVSTEVPLGGREST